MNTMFSKWMGAGGLFLLVFLSGFLLTRAGRPYSQGVITIHKLLALGAVILLGTLVASENRSAPLQAGQWLAVACAALCLAALFVTGGLVSAMKSPPELVTTLHRALPYLAVVAVGVGFYRVFLPLLQIAR
jgi:hypothetical protein